MAKLDIGLDRVVIEDIDFILEFVEEGFEEGPTELSDAMEGGIDVAEDRISLLNGCPDEVSVGNSHTWDSIVELVGLSSLPYRVLVISAEGIETAELVPSCAELSRSFKVKAANI